MTDKTRKEGLNELRQIKAILGKLLSATDNQRVELGDLLLDLTKQMARTNRSTWTEGCPPGNEAEKLQQDLDDALVYIDHYKDRLEKKATELQSLRKRAITAEAEIVELYKRENDRQRNVIRLAKAVRRHTQLGHHAIADVLLQTLIDGNHDTYTMEKEKGDDEIFEMPETTKDSTPKQEDWLGVPAFLRKQAG